MSDLQQGSREIEKNEKRGEIANAPMELLPDRADMP
jgi:hypothetical protein